LGLRFRLGLRVKNPIQRRRVDHDGLPHETEKELAATFGSPPVETEGELVRVVGQALVTDRPLVSFRSASA